MLHILRIGLTKPSVILFISEFVLIYLCVLLATFLRYIIDPNDLWILENILTNSFIVAVSLSIALYYLDAYSTYFYMQNSRAVSFWTLVQAVALSYIFLSIFYYIFPYLYIGRGILVINFFVVILILELWRTTFPLVSSETGLIRRVAILGNDTLACNLKEIATKKFLGFEITRIIPLEGIQNIQEIIDILEKEKLNTLIITKETLKKLPLELLWKCHLRGDQLIDGLSFYEWLVGKVPCEDLRATNILFVYNPANRYFTRFVKRIFDIVFSLILLVITAPFHLLAAFLIKITDPGPVFYSQTRTGLYEKVFTIYKYRTMVADAEKLTGPKQASDHDPRITWIGNYLRKTRFDELPQLINVLKGEMSLIGPRPERPHFTEIYKEKIPYYFLRHSVRPGITGWAQVSHEYTNDLQGTYEKFQYDMYYIKYFSLGLDFIIFLKTLKVVLTGKGAK